jgi:hypothetical protein
MPGRAAGAGFDGRRKINQAAGSRKSARYDRDASMPDGSCRHVLKDEHSAVVRAWTLAVGVGFLRVGDRPRPTEAVNRPPRLDLRCTFGHLQKSSPYKNVRCKIAFFSIGRFANFRGLFL